MSASGRWRRRPSLPTHSHSIKLFTAVDDYLKAKKATANTQRSIDFDRERLEVVKRVLGDVRLSTISSRVIEGFQAKRRLEGASNRTVNMDVGALRQVLKRFKQWRRLEDDVKMLTESGGEPIGRVLTSEEQERLLKAAEATKSGKSKSSNGSAYIDDSDRIASIESKIDAICEVVTKIAERSMVDA